MRVIWGMRPWLLAALAAAVAAPAGWLASDALERRNDFCNACHVEEGVPLHIAIRRDFDSRPPRTLAGLHAERLERQRGGAAAMRCIECHGGVGFADRLRVKALAARDAFVYFRARSGLGGHLWGPRPRRHPLRDPGCRQCHPTRLDDEAEVGRSGRFHGLGVHESGVGVACVECHDSHERSGRASYYYLRPQHVRDRCAQCHSESGG